MGFAVNASTMGMAVAGLVVALSASGSIAGLAFCLACHALDPDRAARGRAGSDHLHGAPHRAGPLHGVCLYADAGLSGRGVQRRRRRWRLRGLHHRQCRKQSDRPADFGRGRRSPRPCARTSISLRCSISPARCSSISPSRSPPDGCHGPRPLPACGLDGAPAQSAAARRLRHWFLHPVRLHRHLHLRQFRPGAPATVARHDAARICLFRVPALDRHHAAGRSASHGLVRGRRTTS